MEDVSGLSVVLIDYAVYWIEVGITESVCGLASYSVEISSGIRMIVCFYMINSDNLLFVLTLVFPL